jgi:hypothetical protein
MISFPVRTGFTLKNCLLIWTCLQEWLYIEWEAEGRRERSVFYKITSYDNMGTGSEKERSRKMKKGMEF